MGIINITGLPGAGKTTLGEKLSDLLGWEVFRIGPYWAQFPRGQDVQGLRADAR